MATGEEEERRLRTGQVQGGFGAASPVRPRSPSGTPPYGRRGLDGSDEGQNRRFVDYKMEPAPSWNGEHPESKYREYARNLKLWLIEAEARLPSNLIGKRILDVIPFGSRLAASLAHLSVDDITAPDGYKQIISVIEDSHAYLKEARLEQAFDAAIFHGCRRPGQTLTGFLATKKAAFAELKKQGLDMLATDAGNHLLGHLLLKQGGFTVDQQQRIRVLTDGSIDLIPQDRACHPEDFRGLPGREPGEDFLGRVVEWRRRRRRRRRLRELLRQ